MIKKIFAIMLVFSTSYVSFSQKMDTQLNDILASVEANNAQLRAVREANAATMAEVKAENGLGETSIEYTPFYRNGISGTASSELIVSQEFDFPTVNACRRKSQSLQSNVLDKQYLLVRRDVLLEVKKTYYDLQSTYQKDALLCNRLSLADSLLSVFTKRMEHGDATIIDVNRIKMDRMTVLREKMDNDGEVKQQMLKLQRLNGGIALPEVRLVVQNIILPPVNTASQMSSEELLADAELSLQSQNVALSKQEWMPKLTLGYRRNTELKEASHGVLVGVSVPLFSTSGKVKAAEKRRMVAVQNLENARVDTDSRQRMLMAEAENLYQQLMTFDTELMTENVRILHHSVLSGALSVIDYYNESDRVYRAMAERIDIENRYMKTVAEWGREER